ncbi:MAG: response regulator [Deltaproteobacteria bacterium]|nr:MAG: response regulator [Deltaproteobacteria bacterium]
MRPNPERLRDLREFPIVYVDDEPENLRIFELTFGRDFTIFTATSGEQGLEIINTKPVAVVVSDHRMPGMTGTEFLARAAQLDPKTIRIMVTAYGDAATLQDAINNGSIYHFIAKPWNPDDVRATLIRGIEAYAMDSERMQLLNELTVLNRVSASLTRELELDRLLGLLLLTLREDLGFDGANLLLLRNAKTRTLEWVVSAAGDEIDERIARISFTPENALEFVSQLEDGRSLTLRSEHLLEYSGAVRQWMTEVAAEEFLVTPLFGKEGLIGAITVDNRRGGRRFVADDVTLIEGLSNQASIAVENARLVDDLRRSREQVRRADRLGSLGMLAAGLAHEINNPLVAINTFLAMAPAKRAENDPEFWGDYHKLTLREVDRIRELVRTMRRLGQGGAGAMPHEMFAPDEVASEVVTLLHREAELGRVKLEIALDPATPKIVGARDQIHQVVLNLVLNALSVTPHGGEVSVRTGPAAGGDGVEIEVRDTGPGIAPEHLEQIFDPFFTTKGPDSGSGLGLMVCHRIATDHRGTIEVTSGKGRGTAFLVRLPLDARAASA